MKMFRLLSGRRRRRRLRKSKEEDSCSLKTLVSTRSNEIEVTEATAIPSDASNVEDQSTLLGSETTVTLTASQDDDKPFAPSDGSPKRADRHNRPDKNLGMVVVVEEDEEEYDNFYDNDDDESDEFGISSYPPTPSRISFPNTAKSTQEKPVTPTTVYSLISDLASLVTPAALAVGLLTTDSEDKDDGRGDREALRDDESREGAVSPFPDIPETSFSWHLRDGGALNRSLHDLDDETVSSLASDSKPPVRSILKSSSSYDGDESTSGREQRRKFQQAVRTKSFLNTSAHSGATDEAIRLDEETEGEDDEDDQDTAVSSVVTFDAIQIREYGVTLGDHPDVTTGPPIALDWDYDESAPMNLDAYEGMKGPSRRGRDMRLTYYRRRNLLLETGQYTHSDLDSASNMVKKIKKQRKRTERLLPVAPLEEAVQSMRRVVSFRQRRGSKSGDTVDDRSVQSMPVVGAASSADDDDHHDDAVACTCGGERSSATTKPKETKTRSRKGSFSLRSSRREESKKGRGD